MPSARPGHAARSARWPRHGGKTGGKGEGRARRAGGSRTSKTLPPFFFPSFFFWTKLNHAPSLPSLHPSQTPDPAKHYGFSTKLGSTIAPADGLAFQYDLKLTDGITCGGAYFKLVSADDTFTPETLVEATPFSIMFGPDKCGATNKVHLILRHAAPNGTIEEKHLVSPPLVETDKLTHTYTLLLHPSNSSYDILVDGVSKKAGLLAEDFDPPFVPPKEIDDPKDTKPKDWVDVAR